MTAGRQTITSKKDWGTPRKYVEAVKRVFHGNIDLDPCSNENSVVHANTEFILPHHDGLKEVWNFRNIYVNPPYGKDKLRGTTIKDWLEKCAFAHEHFGSNVIALIPVAVNTAHWKKYVFIKATAVCFLYDTRLKFLEGGSDTGKGAPMACCIVYWGDDYERFFNVFIHFGAVVNLSELTNRTIGSHHKKQHEQLILPEIIESL